MLCTWAFYLTRCFPISHGKPQSQRWVKTRFVWTRLRWLDASTSAPRVWLTAFNSGSTQSVPLLKLNSQFKSLSWVFSFPKSWTLSEILAINWLKNSIHIDDIKLSCYYPLTFTSTSFYTSGSKGWGFALFYFQLACYCPYSAHEPDVPAAGWRALAMPGAFHLISEQQQQQQLGGGSIFEQAPLAAAKTLTSCQLRADIIVSVWKGVKHFFKKLSHFLFTPGN